MTIENNSAYLSHSGQLQSLDNNLDEFQKVVIPINFKSDDLLKIKYAIKADFYVIIGEKGYIEFEKIKRFFVETSGLKSRCIGFIIYT